MRSRGDYNKTFFWLKRLTEQDYLAILDQCGKKGVDALAAATPRDTGETASSWSYSIERDRLHTKITWSNSNLTKTGEPIAIMLQYGHGTGTGGYVRGRDYINPAIQPIFDDISEQIRKALEI